MKTLKITTLLLFAFCTHLSYSQKTDNENEPEEKIKITKEYDEEGNLIRYDSTYVYSYSKNTEAIGKDLDSTLKNFFSDRESFFLSPSLNFDDFIFPQNFKDLDSIWNKRMERHRKFFDDFFEFKKGDNKDTILPSKKKIPKMNKI